MCRSRRGRRCLCLPCTSGVGEPLKKAAVVEVSKREDKMNAMHTLTVSPEGSSSALPDLAGMGVLIMGNVVGVKERKKQGSSTAGANLSHWQFPSASRGAPRRPVRRHGAKCSYWLSCTNLVAPADDACAERRSRKTEADPASRTTRQLSEMQS